jgi:hypothetical protein
MKLRMFDHQDAAQISSADSPNNQYKGHRRSSNEGHKRSTFRHVKHPWRVSEAFTRPRIDHRRQLALSKSNGPALSSARSSYSYPAHDRSPFYLLRFCLPHLVLRSLPLASMTRVCPSSSLSSCPLPPCHPERSRRISNYLPPLPVRSCDMTPSYAATHPESKRIIRNYSVKKGGKIPSNTR